jgi:hypothetical protein
LCIIAFFFDSLVRAMFPEFDKPRDRLGLTAFLILVFLSVPWAHDLFLHPSLQEKLVILAAGIAFRFFSSEKVQAWKPVSFAAVSSLVLGAALCTKGQFLIYAPAVIALQALHDKARRRKQKYWRTVFVAAVLACGAIGLRVVAAQGAYTGRHSYFSADALRRLSTWQDLFLLSVAFGAAIIARTKGGSFSEQWRRLLPSITLFALVGLFLPWGLNGYLLSSAAPLIAWAVVQSILFMKDRIKFALLSFIPIAALVVTCFRSVFFFSDLGDLRRILASSEIQQIAASGGRVFMPCDEGSGSFEYYLRQYAKASVPVTHWNQNGLPSLAANRYWISDTKLCAPRFKNSESSKLVAVIPPRTQGGFGLYRVSQ